MNSVLKDRGYDLIEGILANEEQLASYDACTHDPFMGNGTRYKRFSQYRLTHRNGVWQPSLLPARAYTAHKKFNPVGGGYRRDYQPLEADFTGVISHLAGALGLDSDEEWQINVHQNRSIANAERNGQLTPEGRHRDGHEFVTISLFARKGVKGGLTRIWADETTETPLWEHTLLPGQTVLLNDRSVLHDVTDIEPESPTTVGTRDILIVAYSRWSERWYGDEHDSSALTES